MIKIGKHGQNAGVQVLADALAGKPESFSNSNESFFGTRESWEWYGQLSADWVTEYKNANVVFTVFSYRTPIGWLTGDGTWFVPEVHYSATTSQHQSKLRGALAYNGTKYTESF